MEEFSFAKTILLHGCFTENVFLISLTIRQVRNRCCNYRRIRNNCWRLAISIISLYHEYSPVKISGTFQSYITNLGSTLDFFISLHEYWQFNWAGRTYSQHQCHEKNQEIYVVECISYSRLANKEKIVIKGSFPLCLPLQKRYGHVLYACMYVCINLFKVGQIYIYVNKKHLALQ